MKRLILTAILLCPVASSAWTGYYDKAWPLDSYTFSGTNDWRTVSNVCSVQVVVTIDQQSSTNVIPTIAMSVMPPIGTNGVDWRVWNADPYEQFPFPSDYPLNFLEYEMGGTSGTNSRITVITNYYNYTDGEEQTGEWAAFDTFGATTTVQFAEGAETNHSLQIKVEMEANLITNQTIRLGLREVWVHDLWQAARERLLARGRSSYTTNGVSLPSTPLAYHPTYYQSGETTFPVKNMGAGSDVAKIKLLAESCLIPTSEYLTGGLLDSSTNKWVVILGQNIFPLVFYSYLDTEVVGFTDDYSMTNYLNAVTNWVPYLDSSNVLDRALIGGVPAPSNYWEWTPAYAFPEGHSRMNHGRVVTSEWTIATSGSGIVTNTVHDYHGNEVVISGTNGQTILSISTNEMILPGYTEEDYGIKYLPYILDQLWLLSGRRVSADYTFETDADDYFGRTPRGSYYSTAADAKAVAIADWGGNYDRSDAYTSIYYDSRFGYTASVAGYNRRYTQTVGMPIGILGDGRAVRWDMYFYSSQSTYSGLEWHGRTGLIEDKWAHTYSSGFIVTNNLDFQIGNTNVPTVWPGSPPSNVTTNLGHIIEHPRVFMLMNSTNAFRYWQNEPNQ